MDMNARRAEETILLAPGVYDALTALLAQQAGAEAVYLSGASIAYTRLGRPDIGLVSMTEVADVVAAIRDRVDLALIVDADTGYGNALNVQRTVRMFERAGADVIQLEDQSLPKRCGHLAGKTLVPTGEMVGKIRAALDARDRALVMARTDAIAVEGIEAALDRAEAYLEAGAEILFVEAPQDDAEIRAIMDRLRGRVPLLANMVEGGRTPVRPVAQLQAQGYDLAIFPGGAVRAMAAEGQRYFAGLMANGSNAGLSSRMFDFAELNQVIGTEDMLAQGREYDITE